MREVLIEGPEKSFVWFVEASGRATAKAGPGTEPPELSREDMELLAPGILEEARRRGPTILS